MFHSATVSRSASLLGLADEELMALAADGEARAFEAIFDRHAAVAYSLASRVCGKRAMVEDVMQDAFLSLWRNSAQFDTGRGSVRSWVLTVVHNRSIDALRRAGVRDSRDAQDPEIAERIAGPDRTETEVIRRDEARPRARGDRPVTGRAMSGDRACIFRRPHTPRDRRGARTAARHGQGEDPARAAEAARAARAGEPEPAPEAEREAAPNLVRAMRASSPR